jgi:hypothetical protein
MLFVMPPQDRFLQFLVSPTAQNLDYYPMTTHAAMFSMGYLIMDLFAQAFYIKDFSAVGIQSQIHHLMAILILSLGLAHGE